MIIVLPSAVLEKLPGYNFDKLSISLRRNNNYALHNVAHCAIFPYHMVVHVRRLIWGQANIKHIARHAVTPDEVEEICRGDPLVQKEHKGRLGLIGTTEEGRLLKIILQSKGKNAYYPIAAHDADESEVALYSHKKGGEKK